MGTTDQVRHAVGRKTATSRIDWYCVKGMTTLAALEEEILNRHRLLQEKAKQTIQEAAAHCTHV